MIKILLILFVAVGITNLVVNASVLESVRNFIAKRSNLLGMLVNCMLCSGFWVGVILGLWISENPLYFGALVSLMAHFYGILVDYLSMKSAYYGSKIEEHEVEDDE